MLFKHLAAGFALSAGLVLALPAMAQPAPYDDETASVGGVTVYGPQRYARQPTTGAWVRMDSVSMRVPLADLDLSTRYGARLAKARIERAARDVCDRAQDAYPNDVEPERGCYATAVRDGLAQAENAVGYPIVAWGYR
jgi:UrcA family protein